MNRTEAAVDADFRRFRSMSDGATQRLPNQEPFEVFPSLPDSVLEKMGLLGNVARERLSDEELEQKFVALSLAFTIDATTVKDRCERQRRYRDQTETNLNTELERLIQKANKMQSLCIDAETTELLSALLGQIDIVMKASSHATISSERYGAVQHENRISESVGVMINHVNLLKQQRDSARRQLQYTKRVLQNSNSSETAPAQKQIATTSNGRVITKRRASIATITRPIELSKTADARKITRRTSDLSLRASSLARSSRPNRLELGVDLVKIKEGMVENEPVTNDHNSDDESNQNEDNSSLEDNSLPSVETETAPLSLRYRLLRRFRRLRNHAEERYDKWTEDGTLHEICCFCALMKGGESKVAALHANVNKNFKIEKNVPYAELWLGTHVNGPSSLKNGDDLSKVIAQHPEYLGDNVRKQFGDQLPFLFKVLSVNQALSIQAHPAKKHAEELHKQRPDIYKDPNHKPELAIALTPFEALCGFRPLPEISFFLMNIPELKKVTGDAAEKYKADTVELLKEAFKAIFATPKHVINEQLKKLLHRFQSLDANERKNQLADLIERLYRHYPDDVGCFVVYFLNYLKLEPFQAIYLGPNLPHAYLYGDCIECMACSDNVVRAGLTPKYIDVDTLCSMIIYKGETAKEKIFKPIVEDNCCQIFKPPVADFAIAQIRKMKETLDQDQ
ncbi:hypothetical protein GEV33_014659 [Tenebrio molitor]|uniref:mannose-6-phosphate isomerase n=1 Tax=Tenebrio molitor TaxID=7067 RepID=A0A8J6L6E9_TENMO|nr:hypothetical protein GEV33_014659 [Tenebrio molitor]